MSVDLARGAVIETLALLERSCLEADAALTERRWSDVATAFTAQERLTGELARLFEDVPQMAPVNDEKVAKRIRGILVYRDDQLRRLRAYHAEVGSRLRAIGRMRAFSRSIGKRGPSAELVDGQY